MDPCSCPAGDQNYSLFLNGGLGSVHGVLTVEISVCSLFLNRDPGPAPNAQILVPTLEGAKISVYCLFFKSGLGPAPHARILVPALRGAKITVYSLFFKSGL